MTTKTDKKSRPSSPEQDGITEVRVRGFKSINQEQSIAIRPLTVLTGANSSGKSSIMQPLLLLKQTLEASYDPGALLLDGPNLKFTSADQLLSRPGRGDGPRSFSVGLNIHGGFGIETEFVKEPNQGFAVSRTAYSKGEKEYVITKSSSADDLKEFFEAEINGALFPGLELSSIRARCFLKLALKSKDAKSAVLHQLSLIPIRRKNMDFENYITQMIHVPGLRGNPLRTYPVSAFGPTFQGTFEKYSASVIAQWQVEKRHDVLKQLFSELKGLGLTWKVAARPINETQVELQVGRLPQPLQGGARDLVSIADVGFGVSQTLPVLVALHAAQPGQLVYVEQPEIHLHPRAQSAMAQVFVNAALRGVRVVVETHSSLLLLGIQTLVAEGALPVGDVKFHWFERSKTDGFTTVKSADLDENGTFGDWPEDFDEVSLQAQSRFLDAAELAAETD